MDIAIKMADNYLGLLSSVSDDIKLRIIQRLSESLLKKGKKELHIRDSFGAWKDDSTAEELIGRIRQARVQGTRKLESFDE